VLAARAPLIATFLLVTLIACGGRSSSASDYCGIAQQIEDAGARYTGLGGPDEIRAAITQVRALLGDLARTAPASVAADIQIVRGSAELADAELGKVGYQLDRLSEQADAAINSPASQGASDRIDAYNKSSCPGFRPAPQGSGSVGT
jgi:hypothetical protein